MMDMSPALLQLSLGGEPHLILLFISWLKTLSDPLYNEWLLAVVKHGKLAGIERQSRHIQAVLKGATIAVVTNEYLVDPNKSYSETSAKMDLEN